MTSKKIIFLSFISLGINVSLFGAAPPESGVVAQSQKDFIERRQRQEERIKKQIENVEAQINRLEKEKKSWLRGFKRQKETRQWIHEDLLARYKTTLRRLEYQLKLLQRQPQPQ